MLLVITHNLVIEMNKDMYVNVRIFFCNETPTDNELINGQILMLCSLCKRNCF